MRWTVLAASLWLASAAQAGTLLFLNSQPGYYIGQGAGRLVTAADGTACDDQDACTQSDACQAGQCTGPPQADAPPRRCRAARAASVIRPAVHAWGVGSSRTEPPAPTTTPASWARAARAGCARRDPCSPATTGTSAPSRPATRTRVASSRPSPAGAPW